MKTRQIRETTADWRFFVVLVSMALVFRVAIRAGVAPESLMSFVHDDGNHRQGCYGVSPPPSE
jgi:hypothetical protein